MIVLNFSLVIIFISFVLVNDNNLAGYRKY